MAVVFVTCGNVSAEESSIQELLDNSPTDFFLIIVDFIPLWIWYLAIWIISFFIPPIISLKIAYIYTRDTGKEATDSTGNSAMIYMGCIFATLNCILFALLLN